jgi:hypothetical protein
MKVMAIGTLKPLSQEQRQRYLPKEVPATLKLSCRQDGAVLAARPGRGRDLLRAPIVAVSRRIRGTSSRTGLPL